MSPCFGVTYINPHSNEDIYIDYEIEKSSPATMTIKLKNIQRCFSCWLVTFNQRLQKPIYIRGSKLHKKIMVDDILSKVESLQGMPDVLSEINRAIDDNLEKTVKVSELRKKPDIESHHYDNYIAEIELEFEIAQSSYIYIDDIGHVMDGGSRYVFDIPAFVDEIK